MLAYTALRLAAIEALNGWTIAGDRLYDSRKFPLDAVSTDFVDDGPSLCVYTEEGEGEPFGTGRIHPCDVRAWLVIEAAVVVRGRFPVTLADGSIEEVEGVTLAERDQAHEAMVDMLAAQVRRRLSIDAAVDGDPAAALFRSIRRGTLKSDDVPQRSGDKATPLAGRTLRFHIALKSADRWGAGGLPEPLATVAAGLTVPSSLAVVADILRRAPAAPVIPGAGPVAVHLEVGVGRSPVPSPDVVADAS